MYRIDRRIAGFGGAGDLFYFADLIPATYAFAKFALDRASLVDPGQPVMVKRETKRMGIIVIDCRGLCGIRRRYD